MFFFLQNIENLNVYLLVLCVWYGWIQLKSLSASQNNKVKPVSIHRYLYYYIIIIICKFLSNDHLQWVCWYEKHSAKIIFFFVHVCMHYTSYFYIHSKIKFLLRCCWFEATLYQNTMHKIDKFQVRFSMVFMICLHNMFKFGVDFLAASLRSFVLSMSHQWKIRKVIDD